MAASMCLSLSTEQDIEANELFSDYENKKVSELNTSCCNDLNLLLCQSDQLTIEENIYFMSRKKINLSKVCMTSTCAHVRA